MSSFLSKALSQVKVAVATGVESAKTAYKDAVAYPIEVYCTVSDE
jgi:hypothetical protein